MKTLLIIIAILLSSCSTQIENQVEDAPSSTANFTPPENPLGVPYGEHIVTITSNWSYWTLEPLLHPQFRIRENFARNLVASYKLGPVVSCEESAVYRRPGGMLGYIAICEFENGWANLRLLGTTIESGFSMLINFQVLPLTIKFKR